MAELSKRFQKDVTERDYLEYFTKFLEVNLGIGLNQLFPETTKIVIDVDDNEVLKDIYPANVEGSEEFFDANKSEI